MSMKLEKCNVVISYFLFWISINKIIKFIGYWLGKWIIG